MVPLVGGLVSTDEVFTEKVWTLGPLWKKIPEIGEIIWASIVNKKGCPSGNSKRTC